MLFSGSSSSSSRSELDWKDDAMPLDRVLPETDGPFGQADGRPLSPGGGGRIYADYAALKGMSMDEAEALMTANFRRIVDISRPLGAKPAS